MGGDFVPMIPPTATHQISIHAPRVGGDGGGGEVFDLLEISIHAPRVGGDLLSFPCEVW